MADSTPITPSPSFFWRWFIFSLLSYIPLAFVASKRLPHDQTTLILESSLFFISAIFTLIALFRSRRSSLSLPATLMILTIAFFLLLIVMTHYRKQADQNRCIGIGSLRNFCNTLEDYRRDTGQYPPTDDFSILIENLSDDPHWRGPYTIDLEPDQLPQPTRYFMPDNWGNPYRYLCPGAHNTKSFDLSSAGPDGQFGTSDDLNNW